MCMCMAGNQSEEILPFFFWKQKQWGNWLNMSCIIKSIPITYHSSALSELKILLWIHVKPIKNPHNSQGSERSVAVQRVRQISYSLFRVKWIISYIIVHIDSYRFIFIYKYKYIYVYIYISLYVDILQAQISCIYWTSVFNSRERMEDEVKWQ